MKRFIIVPLALVLSLPMAGVASAQITQRPHAAAHAAAESSEPRVSGVDGASYVVEFESDALDATLKDGSIPRITVRPVHYFGQLARPRLHFVPELLKSVEVM